MSFSPETMEQSKVGVEMRLKNAKTLRFDGNNLDTPQVRQDI
jgi:hypothetical protein